MWQNSLPFEGWVTLHRDCSHEINRHLLLGKKVMTNLDSILKSRDVTLPTQVCLVKAMVFPVVMYGCESWTIKKAERWRIDAFERWCWRRLLRIPWTARRSNQSILEEISPGCSLEGLMLKFSSGQFSSVAQSCPTVQSHGLQHARPPCPSPTSVVCPDSRPLSWWCHPAIWSSVSPSPAFNLSQHQGLLQGVSQVAKVLEFQLQHQSFQWIFRADFL